MKRTSTSSVNRVSKGQLKTFPQFTSLPLDIRKTIFGHDILTLSRGVVASKGTVQDFGEMLCRLRMLTPKEFHEFVNDTSVKMFMGYQCYDDESRFSVYSSDPLDQSIYIVKEYSLEWDERKFYTLKSKRPENVNYEEVDDMFVYVNLGEQLESFDLLTVYRILRKRLVCNRIAPTSAKESVKRIFEEELGYFQINIQDNPHVILDLYFFLVLHASLLGIEQEFNPSQIFFKYEDNEVANKDEPGPTNATNVVIDTIVQPGINELKRKIRKALDELP